MPISLLLGFVPISETVRPHTLTQDAIGIAWPPLPDNLRLAFLWNGGGQQSGQKNNWVTLS
jgi:hypothetical protein